jgi:hypothetical protein
VQILKQQVFSPPLIDGMTPEETLPSRRARILAITSMFFWIGAITSGRLLAYVGTSAGVL